MASFTYLGVFTSLKAPNPRKTTHLQTPLAGSHRGKEKGSQSKAEFFVAHFGVVLVDEWVSWGIHRALLRMI